MKKTGTGTPSDPYFKIKVRLTGVDTNAFMIVGTVVKALKRAKVSGEDITEFTDEAYSGDYNHLLQTCMKWVEVS